MAEKSLEYKTIDSEGDYDSNIVIQHYEDFQDISNSIQTIKKDSENIGAWEKAGDLLHKNKQFYFQAKTSPRYGLEKVLSEEYNALAKYAENNSSTIFEKLGPEDYSELIKKVPLYKTGNKEHDDLVDAMNEYKKLVETGQDINKIAEYAQKKIIDSDCSEGIKMELLVNIHNEKYLQVIFQEYLNLAKARLDAKMHNGDEKVRIEFLEKVFKESLSQAKGEWKKARPYYFALLEQVYKKEKR